MILRPRPHLVVPLALTLLALAPRMGQPTPAQAASLSFIVNSTVDAPDATPGDGVCADSSGQCTVRAAIQEADAQPAGSSIGILVPTGVYTLTLGPLSLSSNSVRITGTGLTTLWGGGSRVLQVGPTAQVVLVQVTIAGGQAPVGGGIANAGTLLLWQSTVMSNTATEGGGGGIANGPGAQLQLVRSTLVSNTAPAGNGGGILNQGMLTARGSSLSGNTAQVGGAIASTGTLTLTSSALTANTATLYPCCSTHYGGGGLYTTGTVTITRSTLSGNTAVSGGGIKNFGTLTVLRSTVSSNTAGGTGGGINNTGTLALTGSTITANTANVYGGGIENAKSMTMASSTLSDNAAERGGGINNYSYATLAVTNSTFSGNTAFNGGAIYGTAYGTVLLTYVTIAGNQTGVYTEPCCGPTTIALTGTIIADSTNGPNCTGPITESGGYNLDSDGSCGLSKTTDLTDTSPLLGPLADNGGPTQTMALLPGSPAIDHGATPASGCPATDQRGVARPDAGEAQCDVGAYESAYAPATYAISPSSGSAGQPIVLTGTGFGAAETVNLYGDHRGGAPIYTATTQSGGTFVITRTVLQAPAGPHTQIAVGQSSGISATTFTETPLLLLAPATGAVRSQTQASGYGFGAGEAVTLHWNSPAGALLGTATTNGYGTFAGSAALSMTVPLSASGHYTVYALGQSSGARTRAPFTIP